MDLHAAFHRGPTTTFDPEIVGVTADSRHVEPGFMFVAIPGSVVDGREFIPDAIRRGASAVVTDPQSIAGIVAGLSGAARAIPIIGDDNPRRRLALAASQLNVPQPAMVTAVTGTNGKTSTASFTRQIWEAAGEPAASIGTLGVERPNGRTDAGMTTPDPVRLHEMLADLKRDGFDHVVLEASSHGLEQHRLDGVKIAAAAFTNLTQDHLDYHGTMAAYLEAKLRLFRDVLAPDGRAVINADVPELAAFRAAAGRRDILDFGTQAKAIRLVKRHPTAAGQTLLLEVLGERHAVDLPLLGAFQAMNALAALGLCLASGTATQRAVAALVDLKGVPGRVEQVARTATGGLVFVDYAHTPDGLEKVLAALRPHAANRLVCVFGAGGDRDPTKRSLMGAVVDRLADTAIVTDDNPRSEDPALIRRAILAACPAGIEIGDRAEAIDYAMRRLGAGDVLVIAGKGHEQGQIVGATVLPFDDSSVARTIARRLREGR